jgi:hypothetical protein
VVEHDEVGVLREACRRAASGDVQERIDQVGVDGPILEGVHHSAFSNHITEVHAPDGNGHPCAGVQRTALLKDVRARLRTARRTTFGALFGAS